MVLLIARDVKVSVTGFIWMQSHGLLTMGYMRYTVAYDAPETVTRP